ncbi:MAG: diguanylate cyclase [Microbacteriaceae bacterium]|nr:diguanylate cyclase [Microbacteriaceae bacterium]
MDSPVIHTTGADPARVLLIGSGISVGFGVLSHELALPGQLARRLTSITGRAMDIDVVSNRPMTAEFCLDSLRDVAIARYDVVLVTLGLIEAVTFTDVGTWSRDMGRVIDALTEGGSPGQAVFVLAVPPLDALQSYPTFIERLGSRHSADLDSATEILCESKDRVSFLPFRPDPRVESERFRGPDTYAKWAQLIAEPIAAKLGLGKTRASDLVEPQAENERQVSLQLLEILDTEPEERFDRITRTARDLLGTDGAAITFLDQDRQWFKSRFGVEPSQVPRLWSLCDATIQRRHHFIVEDATQDPRFAANVFVTGAPYLRFYAGYPLEAPNGVRVGTLSVFDSSPRGFTDADAALLRGLALTVQNELRN